MGEPADNSRTMVAAASPASTVPLDRLGLLAAACADGCVRIFALPTKASLLLADPLLAHPSRVATDDGTDHFQLWLPPVLKLDSNSPCLTLTLAVTLGAGA